MRKYFILFLSFIFCNNTSAENIQQCSYGGVNSDVAVSISVTDNGSIIVFSTSNSFSSSNDFLLSKIKSNGVVEWSKTYGGEDVETAVHMEKTSDNGYILLGNRNNGNEDIYVIKTDSTGNVLWSKTYGGSGEDFSGCIKEVLGGGYVIAGRTQSYGKGGDDGYLIRIDENGIVLWANSYGTSNSERFYYVDNTNDNGFIIAGIQKTFSNFDQLVIKIDSIGNVIFSKNFGDANGFGNDAGDCIKQTFDGGYILSGQYRAFGSGGEDLALTKISPTGNIEWAKVFGNSGNDRAFDFDIDENGNYILAGYTNSFGLGGFDGFIVKVNQLGAPLWYRTYGYTSDDYFSEIEITSSGYVATGYINGFGSGLQDIFIVKTNFDGGDNFKCANINVVDNFFVPIETLVNQSLSIGCISMEVSTIVNDVFLSKVDFLPVLPDLDSVYVKGEYEVPLNAIPSVGGFKIDGVFSNSFIPFNLGHHLIEYNYEIVPGCIYNYEKGVLVTNDCKYSLGDMLIQCSNELLCIPLKCSMNIGKSVIGLKYCLSYDSTIITPTGNYTLTDIVTHGNNNWATALITKIGLEKIQIEVFYTNNAPLNTVFKGIGDILCLEFRLKDRNSITVNNIISVCQLNEFHETFDFSTCSKSGIITIQDLKLKGAVYYKDDSSGVRGILNELSSFLSVNTMNSDSEILNNNIQSDLFEVNNISNGEIVFRSEKLVPSSSQIFMKYRNGFDAFQMENIITNKMGAPLQIEPSAFTMIAADVDISDKIRSNDISLLQQVIVKKIPGFPQQLPPELEQDYLDWRFIDKRTVDRDQGFKKASSYPYYSSKGYCRDNVPDIPFFLSNQGSCDTGYVETYSAIMLGDLVNGGSGVSFNNFDNQSSTLTLDLDDIHDLGYGTYRVFLNHTLNAEDKFVSLDFALDYDETNISIANAKMTVEDKLANPQWLCNDYNGEEFLFTSYSVNGYPVTGSLMYIDIHKASGLPTVEDLGQLHVFVNGTEVPSTIRVRSQTATGIDVSRDVSNFVNLYPNPADERITISLPSVYAKDVHVEFLNTIGQSVLSFDQEQMAPEIEIDLSYLAAGLYNCLIQIQDKATIVKKVVVR